MANIRSLLRLPVFTSARFFYPVRLPCEISQISATFATSPPPAKSAEKQEEEVAGGKKKKTGRIHSKKPVKVTLVGGKRYLWCACGYSKKQPFCDGTHLWKRFSLKIKQHPVLFKAPKDMEASLCLCKQTKKPPYCDGTHRRQEVQDAIIDEKP